MVADKTLPVDYIPFFTLFRRSLKGQGALDSLRGGRFLPILYPLRRLLRRLGFGEGSLPADVLWGSFDTHSFLPHGGEMNAWQTNPKGRLRGGYGEGG